MSVHKTSTIDAGTSKWLLRVMQMEAAALCWTMPVGGDEVDNGKV